MIELSVPRGGLTVGETSNLTICFTNTGSGLCTQIVFTLLLPPEILLLDNPKIQLGRLAPGKTETVSFRVRPRSAGTFQIRSKNFSYRDRFGGTQRFDDFRAQVVASLPPRPSITPAQFGVEVDFLTTALPFGEWSRLDARITNTGGVDLAGLEVGIVGPMTFDERRWRARETVAPGASVPFGFQVCPEQASGDLPVHVHVSGHTQSGRLGCHVVKTIRVDREMLAQRSRTRLVLFIGANPVNAEPLRLGKEFSAITHAVRQGRCRDRLDIRPCLAATAKDISRELVNQQPQVVHFAGHGGGCSESFAAEYEDGSAHLMSPEELAGLFKESGESVECVVFNACSTLGVARAMAEHVDYVIASPRPIFDQHAITFSEGFYEGLAAGRSILQAFGHGRSRLRLVEEDVADDEVVIFQRHPASGQPGVGG